MLDNIVFVYKKDNQIKARYRDDAIILEDSKDWEHIATLEPRAYIQTILTENQHLVDAFLKG